MKITPKALHTISCCLFFFFLHSQTRKTDSLFILLKTDKEDTNKVNHLNTIALEVKNTDPVLSFSVASQALKIAEKLNFWPGITQSFIGMGAAKLNLGKTDEAVRYLQKGNKLAHEYHLDAWEAKSLIGIAGAQGAYGNFKESLQAYREALKLLETLKDKKNIATVYNGIGAAYNAQGNYNEALNNHFKSLKLRTELDDKNGLAASYNNIGNVYTNLDNFTEALNFYYKAIEINKQTRNQSWLGNNYGNISNVYYRLAISLNLIKEGKTPDTYFIDAREYALKALEIKEKTGDVETIASLYNNIALIDVEQAKLMKSRGDKKNAEEKIKLSLQSYFKVMEIRERTGDKYHLAIVLENIALVQGETRNYTEAKKYFEKSLAIAYEIGSLEQIKTDYSGLSAIDSLMGNYKKSFADYRMYIKYRDSINNNENTRKVTETKLNFEFGVKHAADSVKTLERETLEKSKHDQEIKQQKLYTFFGVIGFILMIVVAGVSFQAFRLKKKTNATITEQKRKLEQKQKEVMDSIKYAQRIQNSLMPSEKYLHKKIQELKNKIT
ncbi:MAG: tetratricopeptide repeat protein [Bacteroidetes bacterium]|nr:tetratricopeptide repeat protein [Bacteroidota bacterium]